MSFCSKCKKEFSSAYHKYTCPLIGTEPPNINKGKNLKNIEDVRAWLSHPSNQVNTELYIIKWDGYIPKLSVHQVDYLWNDPGLARVVIEAQLFYKKKGNAHERISSRDAYEEG